MTKCDSAHNQRTESDGPLIIIIADGWTKRVFDDCLKASLLPEIQSELIDPGVLFSNVVSVFPSVSIASHTTLLTGVNQATHEIPGHRWMSGDLAVPRDYIGPRVHRVNLDMSPKVRTIFEQYPNRSGYAVQSIITRGAKKRNILYTLDSERILSRTADIACDDPNSTIVTWLPRGDVVSHLNGPDSPALVREMIRTSKGIGALTTRLRNAGLLKRTQILFTSDHGQKRVRKRINLAAILRSQGYSSKLNPATPKDLDVAVFTSGDAVAYLYFRHLKFTEAVKRSILTHIAAKEGVGLIFFRINEKKHLILWRRGSSLITVDSKSSVRYTVLSGEDPLEWLHPGQETVLNPESLDAMSVARKYPDILHQYLDSYVPNRSSDVLVTSSEEYHFGKTPRLAWRLGFHRGSHGGPSRDEMLFSAIATGFQINIDGSHPLRSKDLLRVCGLQ